jgi:hypothetical protein
MTNSIEYVSWRKLREFADVDLTKSFVLGWQAEAGTLMVDVDLLLEPDHPFYEKPRPAEKICIRPAIFEFSLCESIVSDRADLKGSLPDIASALEIGRIEDLRRYSDGSYEIRGEFGTVRIDAERPILKLRAP